MSPAQWTTISAPPAALFQRVVNRTRMKKPYAISSEAAKLHQSLFVADLHCDALLSNRDLLVRSQRGHVDVPRLLEGNVALQVFTIPTLAQVRVGIRWLPTEADAIKLLIMLQGWPKKTWSSTFERSMYAFTILKDIEARSQGVFRILRSREEMTSYVRDREQQSGQTAGLMGIEGLHALEGNLDNLNAFFNVGVRIAGFVHLGDNDLGGSAHGRKQGGITRFGESVLEYMEALRMLVDLAHASPKLLDDILARCTRPVVMSHTGLKGAHNNERNISDAHAIKIAETGGIIGIGYFPWAIGACTVKSILHSLLYAVRLVGPDHVALGSDFDGMVATPFDSSGLALITDALLKHGMPPEDIAKIMGGNTRRLLLEVLPSAPA